MSANPLVSVLFASDCLVGLVVKASALRVADPGFESRFLCGEFSRLSHTSDLNTGTAALYWLPWQAPGVIRLALGLVGLVSVYCD